ncbi:MAG: NADH-quinone oxidoreductase subunit N [Planctomycetales bacterium]|nr:NADH-quinone oxidoreductase subunit N [Planctomycetales bacterium]
MTFPELVNSFFANTLDLSIPVFMPEIVLSGTIVLMLLVRIFQREPRFDVAWLALIGSAVALYYACPLFGAPDLKQFMQDHPTAETFTGLLIHDGISAHFRTLLLVFLVLFIIFTKLSGIPDRIDAPDFFTLVLGGVVGMCLMVASNHLFMMFLGIEMASLPSYVLSGHLKGRRKSSEAAIKYAVFGAGTAGVMLYGISLIAGATGSLHLPTIATQLSTMLGDGTLVGGRLAAVILGGLMLSVGIAFKLSAVPFHFWCPDVFEGASAEVNAYLSIASKAAAAAILVRVAFGFSHLPPPVPETEPVAAHAVEVADAPKLLLVSTAAAKKAPDSNLMLVADGDANGAEAAKPADTLAPVRGFIAGLIGVIAALTCTFGNLAAYGQTNIKRLMAYSAIGHAGYMMMPVSAGLVMLADSPTDAKTAVASVAFYAIVYLFMNLMAFSLIAFIRNSIRSEEIADYAGLIRSCPILVVCFTMTLISLIGLPFFAGFVAKFAVFASLAQAGLYGLLVVAGLNTAVSLFYYIRVVKVMCIDPEPESRLPVYVPFLPSMYVVAVTVPVVVLGLWWNELNEWVQMAANTLVF